MLLYMSNVILGIFMWGLILWGSDLYVVVTYEIHVDINQSNCLFAVCIEQNAAAV